MPSSIPSSLHQGPRYDNDANHDGETYYVALLSGGTFLLVDVSCYLGMTPPECNQGQMMIHLVPFFSVNSSVRFPSHSPAFAGSLAPFRDHFGESAHKCTIPISPLTKTLHQNQPLSHAHLACAAAPFSFPSPTSVGPVMRPWNGFSQRNLLQPVGLP